MSSDEALRLIVLRVPSVSEGVACALFIVVANTLPSPKTAESCTHCVLLRVEPGYRTHEAKRCQSAKCHAFADPVVPPYATDVPDYNLSYVYVFAFFVAGALVVTGMMLLSHLLAPFKPTREKLKTYESGEEPVGQAWGRYPTHFYVFALLFVVFDVEVIFLFPWAVLFRQLGWYGLIEVTIFIAILVVGLVYAWKKKALNWY